MTGSLIYFCRAYNVSILTTKFEKYIKHRCAFIEGLMHFERVVMMSYTHTFRKMGSALQSLEHLTGLNYDGMQKLVLQDSWTYWSLFVTCRETQGN